jgi:hypothetical protein
MSWFTRAFGYGLGAAAGRAIFGGDEREKRGASREPIQAKTEAEIQADEKRFDAEAKKLDEDEAAARAASTPTPS